MSDNKKTPKVEPEAPEVPPIDRQNKTFEKIVHATSDEMKVANLLSSDEANGMWNSADIKQVVDSIKEGHESAFTNCLDRVKNAHKDYSNVKYRFIAADDERVYKAIHVEKWKPVNRTSHPRLDPSQINDTLGCVVCMGQILMFRPDKIDKAFQMRYRKKHDEMAQEIDQKAAQDENFYRGGSSIGRAANSPADGLTQDDAGDDFGALVVSDEE